MFCQKCGKVLADGVKYCAACGAKVESAVVSSVLCKNCGKDFVASLDMCPFCGTEVAKEPTVQSDTAETVEKPEEVSVEADKTPEQSEQPEPQLPKFEPLLSGNNREPEVRTVLKNKLLNMPVIGFLTYFSPILLLAYPICLLLCLFENLDDFADFIFDIDELLLVAFYVGVVMCFAKRQNICLTIAFGSLALYELVSSRHQTGFNTLVIAVFYILLAYFAAGDAFGFTYVPKIHKGTYGLNGDKLFMDTEESPYERRAPRSKGQLVAEIACFIAAEIIAWAVKWFNTSTEIELFKYLHIDEFVMKLNYLETPANAINKYYKVDISVVPYYIGAFGMMFAGLVTLIYIFKAFSSNEYNHPKGTLAALAFCASSVSLEIYRISINRTLDELNLLKVISFNTSGASLVVIALAIVGCICGHKYANQQS